MKLISDFQKECPELLLNNDGYEYLSREIQDKYKEQIAEIENILKTVIEGFVEFNNFKLYIDGRVDVRCQYKWSPFFTGVGYFSVAKIDEEIIFLNRTKQYK